MTKLVYYVDTSTFGGMEQTVVTLVEHLDRLRFEVVVAHHGDTALEPLAARLRALGVQSWILPRMRRIDGVRFLPQFVTMLRRERVDIFHAHLNWPLACHHGIAAAVAARVPAVCVSEHAFVPIPWRNSVLIERLISLFVDRYVAVSHAVAEKLLETFNLPKRKIDVVYDGVVLGRFNVPRNACVREELTRGRERPVIFAAGRLDEQKGQRYLLQAARLLPDSVVALAGDGPERNRLQEEARTWGLEDRVLMLGQRDDIPELLSACDVVVQPSAAFEGLGLAAIEGMAAQKPVVVTAVGGPTEVVVDGVSGAVVPPRDERALASALRRLLTDSELAARLGREGRARAERRFSATRMAERLSAIYDAILDGSLRRTRRS